MDNIINLHHYKMSKLFIEVINGAIEIETLLDNIELNPVIERHKVRELEIALCYANKAVEQSIDKY